MAGTSTHKIATLSAAAVLGLGLVAGPALLAAPALAAPTPSAAVPVPAGDAVPTYKQLTKAELKKVVASAKQATPHGMPMTNYSYSYFAQGQSGFGFTANSSIQEFPAGPTGTSSHIIGTPPQHASLIVWVTQYPTTAQAKAAGAKLTYFVHTTPTKIMLKDSPDEQGTPAKQVASFLPAPYGGVGAKTITTAVYPHGDKVTDMTAATQIGNVLITVGSAMPTQKSAQYQQVVLQTLYTVTASYLQHAA
ncbi:MAG: hypothetical protein R2737_15060 [Candidatus Nanopelagicales bacterium]